MMTADTGGTVTLSVSFPTLYVTLAKVNGEWMDFPLTIKENNMFNTLGLSSEQDFVCHNENGNQGQCEALRECVIRQNLSLLGFRNHSGHISYGLP